MAVVPNLAGVVVTAIVDNATLAAANSSKVVGPLLATGKEGEIVTGIERIEGTGIENVNAKTPAGARGEEEEEEEAKAAEVEEQLTDVAKTAVESTEIVAMIEAATVIEVASSQASNRKEKSSRIRALQAITAKNQPFKRTKSNCSRTAM